MTTPDVTSIVLNWPPIPRPAGKVMPTSLLISTRSDPDEVKPSPSPDSVASLTTCSQRKVFRSAKVTESPAARTIPPVKP